MRVDRPAQTARHLFRGAVGRSLRTPASGNGWRGSAWVLAVLVFLVPPTLACVPDGQRVTSIPALPPEAPPEWAQVVELARIGHGGAFLALGVQFDAGIDVAPDPARAAAFYRLALQNGADYFAALLLARLHARGRGVAFAPGLVDHYTRVAAASDPGDLLRDVLNQRFEPYFGADWVPEKPLARARRWWTAREAWPPVRQWREGQRYFHGYGVLKCRVIAKKFLRDANFADEPIMDFLYADHLLRYPRGHGLDQETYAMVIRNNLYWAADAGLPAAQHQLGLLFHEGRLAARRPLAAYYWLWRARAAGVAIDIDLDALWQRLHPDHRALFGRFILHDWAAAKWLKPD